MPIDETIVTGKKFRVWDTVLNKWKRMSYWTKASDVELNNGNDAETEISTLKSNLSWYGTSGTSASTTAKVATTTSSGFSLVSGVSVKIKFTYTNTASTPTLNVNSTGAKTIYAYGTKKPTLWWQAGDVVEFTYNGSYWIIGASGGQIYDLNTNMVLDDFVQTITFPSDGSILSTFSDGSTMRTVFNSDGSISKKYTKGGVTVEYKTVFNSNGSISVTKV